MLTVTGNRIFRIRKGVYYIIECDICDKKRLRRTTPHSLGYYYMIRCRDKRMCYLDDWFECEYNTFAKKEKANILIVLKGKKVYINSYDKMWLSNSKIIWN